MLNSAPPWPITTRPLTMRGAPVIEYCLAGSAVCTSHSNLPVAASTSDQARVDGAEEDLAFVDRCAALTTSQQAFTAHSPGTFGSYLHSSLPLFAS